MRKDFLGKKKKPDKLDLLRTAVNDEQRNLESLRVESKSVTDEITVKIEEEKSINNEIENGKDLLKKTDALLLDKNNELSDIQNEINIVDEKLEALNIKKNELESDVSNKSNELADIGSDLKKKLIKNKADCEAVMVSMKNHINALNEESKSKQLAIDNLDISSAEKNKQIVDLSENIVAKKDELKKIEAETFKQLSECKKHLHELSRLSGEKEVASLKLQSIKSDIVKLELDRVVSEKEIKEQKEQSVPLVHRENKLKVREEKIKELYKKAGIAISL